MRDSATAAISNDDISGTRDPAQDLVLPVRTRIWHHAAILASTSID
jgi:hypothetical protein